MAVSYERGTPVEAAASYERGTHLGDRERRAELSSDDVLQDTFFLTWNSNANVNPRRARSGLAVIRKEAWPFYRTISGVRLCWELEEPEGPKGRGYPLVT